MTKYTVLVHAEVRFEVEVEAPSELMAAGEVKVMDDQDTAQAIGNSSYIDFPGRFEVVSVNAY